MMEAGKREWLRSVIGEELTETVLGHAEQASKDLEQRVAYKSRSSARRPRAKEIADLVRSTIRELDPAVADAFDAARLQRAKELVAKAMGELSRIEAEMAAARGPVAGHIDDLRQLGPKPGATAGIEKSLTRSSSSAYTRSAANYVADMLAGRIEK